MHPLIQTKYDSLKIDVDRLLKQLNNEIIDTISQNQQQEVPQQQQYEPQQEVPHISTVANQTYRPKLGEKLPWFAHGIRGFIQKLWYGNSPDNPNWAGHRTESTEYLTINEYLSIENQINEQITSFFENYEEYDLISNILDRFQKKLLFTINSHFIQVAQTSKEIYTSKKSPIKPNVDPIKTPANEPEINPKPIDPPQPTGNVTTSKDMNKFEDLFDKYKEEVNNLNINDVITIDDDSGNEKVKLLIPKNIDFDEKTQKFFAKDDSMPTTNTLNFINSEKIDDHIKNIIKIHIHS